MIYYIIKNVSVIILEYYGRFFEKDLFACENMFYSLMLNIIILIRLKLDDRKRIKIYCNKLNELKEAPRPQLRSADVRTAGGGSLGRERLQEVRQR